MIWALCAVLTLAAVAALIWPLVKGTAAADDIAADQAVFKDQLVELEREIARGTIGAAEAEAARVEIQRRLLAAGRRETRTATSDSPGLRAGLTAVVAVAVPFAALGTYFALGAPSLKDAPAAARIATADGEHDGEMEQMVAQLAERMAADPDNAEGWALLARSYRQIERYDMARDAYRHVLELGARSPDLLSDYAEMITATSGGQVTDEALDVFFAALEMDRTEPRARFYIGMAAAQRGDAQRGIAIWRDLTATAPADAPWLEMVRNQMFQVAQATAIMPMNVEPAHPLDDVPAPDTTQQSAAVPDDAVPASDPEDITSPDVSALQGRFSGENLQMIQAMVGSLAGRLANEPEDFEGWMMLGRSYMVLRDTDGAREAFAQAAALRPNELEPKQQLMAAVWAGSDLDAPGPLPEALTTAAEDILSRAPNSADALLIRGLAQAKRGEADAARATLNKAAAAAPPNSPLAAEIGQRLQSLPK